MTGPAALLGRTLPPADLAVQTAVIRAMRRRPLGVLSLDSAVVLEGALARAVIRLRVGDDLFTLAPAETWCLAIAVRLCSGLVAAHEFAEALALAARQAVRRLETLDRFGAAQLLAEEG